MDDIIYDLDPYTFKLYIFLLEKCTKSGYSVISTRELSETLGISVGKISYSKRFLLELGLITISRDENFPDVFTVSS